jgi:hypothetical protein
MVRVISFKAKDLCLVARKSMAEKRSFAGCC